MVFIPSWKIGERKYKQIINFRACGQKIQEHKSKRLNKIKRWKKMASLDLIFTFKDVENYHFLFGFSKFYF